MPTLVCKNPPPSSEKPLEERIDTPRNYACCNMLLGESRNDVEFECREITSEQDTVPKYIAQRFEGISLETVFGDGIVNLLNCEIWDFELVAVGV